MEHRLLTDHEKLEIYTKAAELDKAGRKKEAIEVRKAVPLPPYLAKIMKEKVGAEYLINGGWNLKEAEAEYGSDWLAR